MHRLTHNCRGECRPLRDRGRGREGPCRRRRRCCECAGSARGGVGGGAHSGGSVGTVGSDAEFTGHGGGAHGDAHGEAHSNRSDGSGGRGGGGGSRGDLLHGKGQPANAGDSDHSASARGPHQQRRDGHAFKTELHLGLDNVRRCEHREFSYEEIALRVEDVGIDQLRWHRGGLRQQTDHGCGHGGGARALAIAHLQQQLTRHSPHSSGLTIEVYDGASDASHRQLEITYSDCHDHEAFSICREDAHDSDLVGALMATSDAAAAACLHLGQSATQLLQAPIHGVDAVPDDGAAVDDGTIEQTLPEAEPPFDEIRPQVEVHPTWRDAARPTPGARHDAAANHLHHPAGRA
mmetsp:Transcript_41607/g.88673  ORF Transcript_41607/g.88673 Transcript_41607/m.88673 type:complete len:349 (-) Transcript_41607:667-1713(-)